MEVNELREKRQKLESEIRSSVSTLVEKFKEDTGFAPYQISIDMVSVTNMGDTEPQFFVDRCHIDISI